MHQDAWGGNEVGTVINREEEGVGVDWGGSGGTDEVTEIVITSSDVIWRGLERELGWGNCELEGSGGSSDDADGSEEGVGTSWEDIDDWGWVPGRGCVTPVDVVEGGADGPLSGEVDVVDGWSGGLVDGGSVLVDNSDLDVLGWVCSVIFSNSDVLTNEVDDSVSDEGLGNVHGDGVADDGRLGGGVHSRWVGPVLNVACWCESAGAETPVWWEDGLDGSGCAVVFGSEWVEGPGEGGDGSG